MVKPELSHIHNPDSTAEPTMDLHKDHFTSHTNIQDSQTSMSTPFNIAQTSMRDLPLQMVLPKLSHIHKQDSTAMETMDSSKRTERSKKKQLIEWKTWTVNRWK